MIRPLSLWCVAMLGLLSGEEPVATYDATFPAGEPRPILTPESGPIPRINGPRIIGVRPGKPLLYTIPATGEPPLHYAAENLPPGMRLDPQTGRITGRTSAWPKEIKEPRPSIHLTVSNVHGRADADIDIVVGEDAIGLTPPLGWNSWYVYSESVSDTGIRQMADALRDAGLVGHGWSYINIDDCWTGERDPQTKAIRGNAKFPDMAALAAYVHDRGMKLGVYSTPWMSTYAGYIGGSAPTAAGDYTAHYRPLAERQGPGQYFGRYPGGIEAGLCTIGPHWLVDVDARQFAAWGVDFVKYDWKEWPLIRQADGKFQPDPKANHDKTEAVIKRFHDDFRAVDRDIVLSLSPRHSRTEDPWCAQYANLWRLTEDIQPGWPCLAAPFQGELAERHARSRPGHFGDLDMLQIGSIGIPNSTNTNFKPSPLTPAEQYFQVTLWCLLQQPLLLSCDLGHLDDFTRGLITNDEVLAVDQTPRRHNATRLDAVPGRYEVWAATLGNGRQTAQVYGLFNLSPQRLAVPLTTAGGVRLRDLWRQRDLGPVDPKLLVTLEPHGCALLQSRP
jgi:alpha-galactosidase